MSEKKNHTVLNFIKKNLYYILIGISLIIIATVIAIVLATNSAPLDEGKLPEQNDSLQNGELQKPNQDETQKPVETPDDNTQNEPTDTPVDNKIVFIMPIEQSAILKNYTSSTVVYNQTLGVYTGHMGIDFGADSGSNVLAVYGGKIESITTSYLQGTTVTIDHGNGLKSIYNSIDALESLAEGQTVNAGDVIGMVSDNNRQEYKDGPHLHFEVTLNGERVDPNEYLMLNEK